MPYRISEKPEGTRVYNPFKESHTAFQRTLRNPIQPSIAVTKSALIALEFDQNVHDT